MVLGNFQRQGILIIWIKVGQGLLVCVGGVPWIFFLTPIISHSFLHLSSLMTQ